MHALSAKPPAAQPVQLIEIVDPASLEALQPEWSALFEACAEASPFQSPEWLLAWRRAFLSAGLWTLAFRRAGRLIGLAPLYLYRDPGTGRRQITLLGNGISDWLDVIALPGEADAVTEALFGHLARSAARWDHCDFRNLPADSPLLRASLPLAALESIEVEEPCPVLALPSVETGITDGLSRKRRGTLVRRARQLCERGLVIHHTATAETGLRDLETVQHLHGSRWGACGSEGVLADPATQRFHADAVPGLLARGLLRLDVLIVGGQAIAAHYGLRRGRRGFSYLHGFDPTWARYGPSALLIALVLAAAVRDGLGEFDFLRGRESYKYEWGAIDRPQFRRIIQR
jgi:CelD/BcsL family acetyltransferase involved in cellulose biosynthesis